ncbi:MAG: class I SAM-dependent methyltransferase family protein [Halobacteriales archaeon]
MPPLAAVVGKERTGEAIAALRSEGVYDDTRRVRAGAGDTNELPVTAPPAETDVRAVIEQSDPEHRVTGLDDLLRERGWSDAEIERAPGSWAVVGDVVLVRFPGDCPRRGEVGRALLDLQGADTVLARRGIEGEHREPDVEVVAGSGRTETVHTEHGTRYALDLAEVMFSPGNKAERARMGEVATEGERVLDMFAGIGYFALPMARAGAGVTAIERNPAAFRYLTENAVLNGVEDRFRPIRADCRDVVGWAADGLDVAADRVVMGHYDAHEYLDAALAALEPGGVLHMHEATPEALLPERPVERLRAAAAEAGRTVEGLEHRRVKTHSEGVVHAVVDARIG